MAEKKRLGIGFIGTGFITHFHIKSFEAIRNADINGFYSPDPVGAQSAAALTRSLGVGDPKLFNSIEEMVADPSIDAIWICSPNFARVENMEAITRTVKEGKGELIGVACEKPLGRNVAEAKRMVELAEEAGLLNAYLEDQLFTPGLVRGREIIWARGASITGRPYLARASEEHSGPHSPWFWQGEMQGGGVLLDMMCHSVEVARFLLTKPGAPRNSIRPVKVTAQVAGLKWVRPHYSEQLRGRYGADIDYLKRPSEDFARATVEYVDDEGNTLIAETTTSWSFVGPGLRLSSELLGPEYSFFNNSLNTGSTLFFSREVRGSQGEDIVEKQNSEQGLMPLVADEAAEYGYVGENRHFVNHFLAGTQPAEDFRSGLEVIELLMPAYMSAEEERTIPWKPEGLEDYRPPVSKGVWKPKA